MVLQYTVIHNLYCGTGAPVTGYLHRNISTVTTWGCMVHGAWCMVHGAWCMSPMNSGEISIVNQGVTGRGMWRSWLRQMWLLDEYRGWGHVD